MTQRRTGATDTSYGYHSDASSTYSTPYMASSSMYHAATPAAPTPMTVPSSSSTSQQLASAIPVSSYEYNRAALVFLIPPLLAMLYSGSPVEESQKSLLLPVFLCATLVLYSLDLANWRHASLSGTWLAFVGLTVVNALDLFRNDNARISIAFWMCQVTTETLIFACWVRRSQV